MGNGKSTEEQEIQRLREENKKLRELVGRAVFLSLKRTAYGWVGFYDEARKLGIEVKA